MIIFRRSDLPKLKPNPVVCCLPVSPLFLFFRSEEGKFGNKWKMDQIIEVIFIFFTTHDGTKFLKKFRRPLTNYYTIRNSNDLASHTSQLHNLHVSACSWTQRPVYLSLIYLIVHRRSSARMSVRFQIACFAKVGNHRWKAEKYFILQFSTRLQFT